MLDFHRIGRDDKIILAGALAMALGTFLPLVRFPLLGTLNYLSRGQGDGIVILILAGAIVAAVIFGYRRISALLGLAALAVIATTLVHVMSIFSKVRGEAAGNPFAGIFLDTIGLEWGWLFLIGGALTVMGAGMIPRVDVETVNEQRQTSSKSERDDNDPAHHEIDQKIAHYVQQHAIEQRQMEQQKPIQRSFGKRLGSRSIAR